MHMHSFRLLACPVPPEKTIQQVVDALEKRLTDLGFLLSILPIRITCFFKFNYSHHQSTLLFLFIFPQEITVQNYSKSWGKHDQDVHRQPWGLIMVVGHFNNYVNSFQIFLTIFIIFSFGRFFGGGLYHIYIWLEGHRLGRPVMDRCLPLFMKKPVQFAQHASPNSEASLVGQLRKILIS